MRCWLSGSASMPRESLSELAKLHTRLIIQRAIEDRVRRVVREERAMSASQRRPPGLRNGCRPRSRPPRASSRWRSRRSVEAAEPCVSKLFPRGTKLLRPEPLKAMVIGAFVRGLSMRDVESLCDQAGLGSSRNRPHRASVPTCANALRPSGAVDLYDIHLAALFLTRPSLLYRPNRPEERVMVASGFTEDGERGPLWR